MVRSDFWLGALQSTLLRLQRNSGNSGPLLCLYPDFRSPSTAQLVALPDFWKGLSRQRRVREPAPARPSRQPDLRCRAPGKDATSGTIAYYAFSVSIAWMKIQTSSVRYNAHQRQQRHYFQAREFAETVLRFTGIVGMKREKR